MTGARGPARESEQPLLSVVVPTYQGEEWVTDCLDSLAAQTLPWNRFEVLLVQNGPADRTPDIVRAWLAAHPGFPLRYLVSGRPGVSAARNLGLDEARAPYVTFVDDDDRAGPGMLAALVDVAAEDAIGSVLIGVVTQGDYGKASFDNWYSSQLIPLRGVSATRAQLHQLLTATSAKVVLTEIAREVRFDERIRKGQDTVFWVSVAARRPLRHVVSDAGIEAAYFYHQRAGSLRQFNAGPTWEHNVVARACMAAALAAIPVDDPEVAGIRDTHYRVVFESDVKPYLRVHPDERERVLQAFRDADVPWVPWKDLNGGLARELALIGTLDPLATDHVTRLLERGVVVDVLTYARPDAPSAVAGAEELLDKHFNVPGTAAVTGDLVEKMVPAMLRVVAGAEIDRGAAYASLYSRSASPLEHIVAAALKAERPEWSWTAETAAGIGGAGADAPIGDGPVARRLRALIAAHGASRAPVRTLGALATALVATLADTTLADPEPVAPELVVLGVDDERPAQLFAARGQRADLLVLPLPEQDAESALAPATQAAGEVSAIVVPEVSWRSVELLLAPLRDTIEALRRRRGQLGAVWSVSASPLEHLAAALVKLSAPEVRWTAELLDGLSSDAERTGQDAYDGASAMRQALVAAAEAGGHPVAGAPTELAAFTGWLAETVADRVVTRDPSLVGSA